MLLAATQDGRILLEVHPDVYQQRVDDPLGTARALARENRLEAEIDWSVADAVVREQAGIARGVQLGGRVPTGA